MRRAVLVIAVLALSLAGCGGRGMHVLPSGRLAPESPVRGAQSSNVDTFNGTLWYGDDRSLYGVPLTHGPATTRIAGSYAGLVGPSSRAMNVAPDGTIYELIRNNAGGPNGWQLRIYAPGSNGTATPEETLSGPGYPQQVFLVGDGIDVLWNTAAPGRGGSSTLSTFAYGAHNNAPPIRTLALGTNVSDAASDRSDKIYVARSGSVVVYPAAARCTCAPVRTIATGLKVQRSLAVASDGTVYVLADDPAAQTANVYTYAPPNNGGRVLGPFYESADVAPPGWPVSSPTGGITVDNAGDLYIGFADGAGGVRVEMYAPNDYGTPAPRRVIATPAFSTYLTSIAIGPALPGPAIQPTLYVGSRSQVLAFGQNASGKIVVERTITGFYKTTPPPPYGDTELWNLVALVAAPDGTLDTLQARSYAALTSGFGCEFEVWAPTANGTSGLLSSSPCEGGTPRGMARGVDGEADFLIIPNDAPYGWIVRRAVDGVLAGRMTLPETHGYQSIAVDGSGTIFLGTTDNHVEVYAPYSNGSPTALRTFALNGAIGPMCAARDGTLYVGTYFTGNPPSADVYAIPPGGSAPARTIGPFAKTVSALACDTQGRLFVGLSSGDLTSTSISIFRANANGAAQPVAVIDNPIPPNDPGGQVITSMSVSL